MSLRLDMLRAAGRTSDWKPEAAARAARFLQAAALPDGGYRDRAGASDLYYTAFALQGLAALGFIDEPAAPEPAAGAAGGFLSPTRRYLAAFADGAALDFVHLACLARCWAIVGGPTADVRGTLLGRIEAHRTADGGYNASAGAPAGTAYAAFLALGAYEDFDTPLPDPAGLGRSAQSLRTRDGGYANEGGGARASTPATAAAITVLAELGEETPYSATAWLLAQAERTGGFRAMAGLPVADLLSTATALHALARAGVVLGRLADACLSFTTGLQTPDGGFRGHVGDDTPDCEYTFYGLLALGHLLD